MRKREGFVKQAAIFAAAALVVPAAVQAKEDPGEELEEILETQMEQGEKSLLSKTLGLDELQENMEEEGFSVQTKFGVSRETWELLGVEAPTSEDGYLQMNLRAAEDAERWQFDLEAATDENTKFLTFLCMQMKTSWRCRFRSFMTERWRFARAAFYSSIMVRGWSRC